MVPVRWCVRVVVAPPTCGVRDTCAWWAREKANAAHVERVVLAAERSVRAQRPDLSERAAAATRRLPSVATHAVLGHAADDWAPLWWVHLLLSQTYAASSSYTTLDYAGRAKMLDRAVAFCASSPPAGAHAAVAAFPHALAARRAPPSRSAPAPAALGSPERSTDADDPTAAHPADGALAAGANAAVSAARSPAAQPADAPGKRPRDPDGDSVRALVERVRASDAAWSALDGGEFVGRAADALASAGYTSAAQLSAADEHEWRDIGAACAPDSTRFVNALRRALPAAAAAALPKRARLAPCPRTA